MNAGNPSADETRANSMAKAGLNRMAAPDARAGDALSQAAAWRWALGALALGAACVLALYWDTATCIVLIWWDSPACSHGFRIAPISAFLIW